MKDSKALQRVITKNELSWPSTGQIHVLVKIPGIRYQSDECFGESFHHVLKKRRVNEDEGKDEEEEEKMDRYTRFFEMRGFPPLAHPKAEYKTILEREAYVVIFSQLVKHAKSCFEYVPILASEPDRHCKPGKDFNVIVTGNPGIGKSRFYLYCIFQFILGEQEDVKQLPPYELLLNYANEYHRYDAASKDFIKLTEEYVHLLRRQPRLLRLVEATSTHLVGWMGVSILFAAPDVKGLRDFEKGDGVTYIMPTWSLEELTEYNSLLPGDLMLAEDEVVSRYDTFGGIPRFIFTKAVDEAEAGLKKANNSLSALDIISYCRRNAAVKEMDHSHRILQMVPTQANFRTTFYLDFLSMHIAELVIDKAPTESTRTRTIRDEWLTHDKHVWRRMSVVRDATGRR